MTANCFDTVVIGGGPAGMAAALEVAAAGARVLVIDNSEGWGGHFYKQHPASFIASLSPEDKAHLKELNARQADLQQHQVTILTDTNVWGIFQGVESTFGPAGISPGPDKDQGFTLYLDHPEQKMASATAPTLILAPGVYDRPIPFPGWTLPGVLTPGGVQMLLKKQGLLPGKRVLVAGTGPLQMAVAANLVDEGAEVVALLDTCAAADGWSDIPGAMWGQWGRMREGAGYLWSLRRHRVPMLFQHAVYQALGTPETGVQGAVIGRVDANGHPVAGTERTLEQVDTICIAYGFAPSIALTLHLGCGHVYNERLCAYIPRHDRRMETDLSGVFVAGDVTGVGGKGLADLQGHVAGISALENLGRLSTVEADRRRAKLGPGLKREERFARLLWRRFRIRPGLLDLIRDETTVCRCEGVTAGQLLQSMANGSRDLAGAKLRTRLGMGVCQGRYCSLNAAMLLARKAGCRVEDIGLTSIRPPIVPVRTKNIFVSVLTNSVPGGNYE